MCKNLGKSHKTPYRTFTDKHEPVTLVILYKLF